RELSSPWDSFDLERLIGGDSSSSSQNELDEQPQIVMCGRNLFRVLMAACSSLRHKREAFSPSSPLGGANRFKRTGLVDLCCHKACTIRTLLQFC
ncbi:Uncharacterized protein FKW44_025032, partial [Caligus rogercresseyi]